jgi:eukaryotic-like serine/threonine-protein kinase
VTTSQSWLEVKDLFSVLADSSPAERQSKLDLVNADLRLEVERLLAHHDAAEAQGSPFEMNPAGSFELLHSILAAEVFEAGTMLADRFEVVRLIGRGGMGEVYEAFDHELQEAVAIKTIQLDLAIDPQIVERFKREVLHSRKVTHPNVCRVYDFFLARAVGDLSVPFFTMELLNGTTLLQYLRDRGGALPIPEALPIALEICEGLAAAHRRGILHRDLKSANVFLARASGDSRPTAKITDFGLARLLSAPPDSSLGDPARLPSGTPYYMAPELTNGALASAASDIFALGVILHRMVLGRYPSSLPASPAAMAAGSADPASWGLPRGWTQAIQACLAADPQDRPGDPSQLAAMLSGRPMMRWIHNAQTRIDGLSRRRIVIGGMALLGAVGVGVEEAIRNWPRPPFAHRQYRALVEEFESQDTGAALGRSVRNMVRIALSQSPDLHLISPDSIERAAAALDLGPVPVRGVVGRRLAQRTGAEVAIGGRIHPEGQRYLLQIQAARAGSGEVLASMELPAATLRDMAQTVERACSQLRIALSGADAKPSPNPSRLEPADTLMPDALEMFTSGLDYFQHGDMKAALAMLQSATRRDPDFAMAYVYQSVVHSALRRGDLAFEPALRAYALRERVNQRQRLQAEVLYSSLSGDYQGSLDRQRALVAIYPNEARLHLDVAQRYLYFGRLQEALQHARTAVDLAPDVPHNTMILAGVLTESGRTAEALQLIARARQARGDSPLLLSAEGSARVMQGDYSGAMRVLDELARQKDYENHAHAHQIRCLVLSGRLTEARTRLESDVLLATVGADVAAADLARYWLGQLLAVEGNNNAAREQAQQLASRPAAPFSLIALRGAAEVAFEVRAASLVSSVLEKIKIIERDYPSTRVTGIRLQVQGLLTMLQGNPAHAGQLLQEAYTLWPDLANTWSLADAAFARGLYQQSLPLYQAIVDRKGSALHWEHIMYWVRSLAMTGFCHRALHMDEDANRDFDRFLTHWGSQNDVDLVKQVVKIQSGK